MKMGRPPVPDEQRARTVSVTLVEPDWVFLRRMASEQREERALAADDPGMAERIRCGSASVSRVIRWLIEQERARS